MKTKPFTYNTGAAIPGTKQVGYIATATGNTLNTSPSTWYNGPNEDLGYIICSPYPTIVQKGLVLNLDAGNVNSYSGTGTIWYDLSGNNNYGTLINGPTYNSENKGGVVFDGVNDYADMDISEAIVSNTITISGFIKWNAGTGGMFLGMTTYCVWTQSGTLGYNNGASNVIGISAATVSNLKLIGYWHHYTFVMNKSGLLSTNKIYIDGIQYSISPVVASDGNIPGFNNNLRLCSWNASGFYGNMTYGYITVYKRELSLSEIQQNYNAAKGRFGL